MDFSLSPGSFTGIQWIPEGANPLYSQSLEPVSPSIFNPADFDAGQWAATARDAGARYLLLTAKHHDGFCLWPTEQGQHNVKYSAWRAGQGDVVGDVAEACRKAGLGFGIYLSPWDAYAWHTLKLTDSQYDDYYCGQLAELLTRYGKIMEVWFDGAGARMRKHDWIRYYSLVRELQPEAVAAISGCSDVRWVWELPEEQGLAPEPNHYLVHVGGEAKLRDQVFPFWPEELLGHDYWWPAESYMPIDRFWSGETRLSFGHRASTLRTVDELISGYHGSVGRGVNLVVNFVPDQQGRISKEEAYRFRQAGDILKDIYAENCLAGGLVSVDSEHGLWQEIDMGRPVVFDRVVLQEAIEVGQQIEAFRMLIPDGLDWRQICAGTTVGQKRIEVFQTVSTTKLRIETRIDFPVQMPVLRFVGAYLGKRQ